MISRANETPFTKGDAVRRKAHDSPLDTRGRCAGVAVRLARSRDYLCGDPWALVNRKLATTARGHLRLAMLPRTGPSGARPSWRFRIDKGAYAAAWKALGKDIEREPSNERHATRALCFVPRLESDSGA